MSMSFQATLFLTTVIMGIIVGFIYDWFRVFRRIIKHSNIFIQIEDCIYWIFVSIATFVIMLNKNYGEIRAFLICGVFIGMVIYFNTISILFMKVSMAVVKTIKKVLVLFFNILITPFKLLFKLLSFPANLVKGFFVNTYLKNKKVLKKYKKYAKIKKTNLIRQIKIILGKF